MKRGQVAHKTKILAYHEQWWTICKHADMPQNLMFIVVSLYFPNIFNILLIAIQSTASLDNNGRSFLPKSKPFRFGIYPLPSAFSRILVNPLTNLNTQWGANFRKFRSVYIIKHKAFTLILYTASIWAIFGKVNFFFLPYTHICIL